MATYRTPYNLQPSESCDHCGAHSAGFFCQLAPATLKKLEAISFVTSYPQNAVLFVEGQAPRGVYMICRGQAKLSVVSQDGRTLIYAVGNGTNAKFLAQALQEAGAYYAMQLDINQYYAQFDTYSRANGQLASQRLLDQMTVSPGLFLTPSVRDFFYVTMR